MFMFRPNIALHAMLLMLACGSLAAADEPLPAPWRSDVNAAYQSSRDSGRPLVLFISTDNCHFCDKMKQQTFTNPAVASALEHSFVSVAVNAADNPELIQRLGVRAYPITLIVSPEAKIRDVIGGYVGPQEFARRLTLSATLK